MDTLNDIFATLSSFLWGWPMIILLLGTHLFLTIRLRFPQRKIFKAIKLSARKTRMPRVMYPSLALLPLHLPPL